MSLKNHLNVYCLKEDRILAYYFIVLHISENTKKTPS